MRRNYIKKLLLIAILCLCMTVQFLSPMAVSAEKDQENAEEHFVIMFDVSGSMNDFDSEQLLISFIAQFLSDIPSYITPYKISIIPFADNCPYTHAVENDGQTWWEIQTPNSEKADLLKRKLGELKYTGKYTDIESALNICCKTLADMRADEADCHQTVLFVTDGYVELPGGNAKEELENIIGSAEKLPALAEEFPTECEFWAIVPEDFTSNVVRYDDNGNIDTYSGVKVTDSQQESVKNVIASLPSFCERLNELRPEGTPERAGIIKMIWNEDVLENFRKSYQAFIEKLWGASGFTEENVDLYKSYFFQIPDGLNEVNITLTPQVETLAECKAAVKQLMADNIYITRNDSPIDCQVSDSISAVSIKIIEPESGVYCIRTPLDSGILYTLSFFTYSEIEMELPEEKLEGVLGTEMPINVDVVDSSGRAVGTDVLQHITISFEEVKDGHNTGNAQKANLNSNTGKFEIHTKPTSIGSSSFIVTMTYDDIGITENVHGISRFTQKKPLTITTSEVNYQISDGKSDVLKDKSAFKAVIESFFDAVFKNRSVFTVQPYSEFKNDKVKVKAADTKEYLNDNWVLRIYDKNENQLNEDDPLLVSEDGNFFVREIRTSKDIHSAKVVNLSTGENKSFVISSLPKLIFFGILASILIFIVLFILIKSTSVKVAVRQHGIPDNFKIKKSENHQRKILSNNRPIYLYYSNGNVFGEYNRTTYPARKERNRYVIDL